MSQVLAFIEAHYTAIGIITFWCFSQLMSSLPPLPADTPWFAVWMHNFFQALAANGQKFMSAKTTLITPEGTQESETKQGTQPPITQVISETK
jgi:hypothetical protein